MCDFFSDKGGDLADVVRNVTAAASLPSTTSTSSSSETATASWQFPVADSAATACFQQLLSDDYAGDSYNLRDPLLHELMGTTFFEGEVSDRSGGSDMSGIIPIKPLPIIGMGDYGKEDHGLSQILSPRAPGIKRRKSQAKKVVCIPAPAAASSRPSGEVVPSDLWAWRKYGQKPIKGSPYPRGYYRCSSSKGCSARKQVERSRHDPNMLVITYTSEHNHPWPTQRNALAGSTRSQPSKNSTPISSSSSSLMEEPTSENSSSLPAVKEEESAEMEDHINDFFADLVELDADPMSLIFFKNRTGGGGGHGGE